MKLRIASITLASLLPHVAAVLTAVVLLQSAKVLAAEPVVFRTAYAPALSHNPLKGFDKLGNYAITTERWRYLHYLDGSEGLYDIHSDPHEWTNLAAKSEHATKLAVMRSLAPKLIAPVHVSPRPNETCSSIR